MIKKEHLQGEWYHGDERKTDFINRNYFDVTDHSRDRNAMGPGIYFTRLKYQASGYAGDGGYVYTVTVDLDPKRTLEDNTKPDPRIVRKFIEKCPDKDLLYNYSEDINSAVEVAVEMNMESSNMLEAIMGVYNDLYQRDAILFAKVMTEVGYDAFYHKVNPKYEPTAIHLIVYNPKIINIIKEERKEKKIGESNMKYLKAYKLFEDAVPPAVPDPKTDIELNPVRFFDIDPADMYDFVEGLLGRTKLDVSFTEKIAGQHMTVEIQKGEIFISTKGKEKKLLKDTPFNWRITKAIAEWAAKNKPQDVIWRFEVVHPRHNHDFIKYKNTESVAVEYSGRMSKLQADEITALAKGAIILSRDQIVPALKQEAQDELKSWWDGGARQEFRKLRTTNKGSYYKRIVNNLRSKLIQIISGGFVSAVDKASPVEGVVGKVRGKTFKLQGKDYLDLQSVQMPFYSLVKMTKEESDAAIANPQKSFEDLRVETNLPFSSIYDRNAYQSFEDTILSYLEGNSAKLSTMDKEKYNRWFDPKETEDMLNDLNSGNKSLKEIYFKIRRIALNK